MILPKKRSNLTHIYVSEPQSLMKKSLLEEFPLETWENGSNCYNCQILILNFSWKELSLYYNSSIYFRNCYFRSCYNCQILDSELFLKFIYLKIIQLWQCSWTFSCYLLDDRRIWFITKGMKHSNNFFHCPLQVACIVKILISPTCE